MLLPIIIFESGYNMKTKGIFFKNIGTILIYAIFGSLFSAIATGLALSGLFSLKLFDPINMSSIECLIFGSLIAATDPVSTLAVFGALSVEPMLSMIMFGSCYDLVMRSYGESVINDAVSIVMFNTMSKFLLTPMSFLAICDAVWTFLVMFLGSTVIGALIALFCCLVLKYVRFPSVVLETIIVFLTAYLAFELTESCELSGITASLSCGITMNYFGLRNLPKAGQEFSQQAVKVASSVADTLIFFQVGENVFLKETIFDVPWKLVLAVFVIIILVRAVMIFGFTYLINMKRTKSKISVNSQIMMVHAGLRGAIAYSLALVFPSHNQEDVTRVTMWIVILTIFTQGCSTYDMLHLLRIPLHCNYDTNPQNAENRKKRSVMASSGTFAAKLTAWIENRVIPFFTNEQKEIEQPLLKSSITPCNEF
ncbi:uncharacterized protein [Blastocystis hominis]|uniref:Sodium/hydrogen exchanger n=1 Tax=Blastocystis hominis TaxID=12968 RepID=D8M6F3_BLAHO|nr:uncharacterized protein [Blastocystis hominis]CBK23706.2 unnamed protein product [Blastocystis hominis]|eukprot:XP_012897754.1 uncharacterized protein [Blastocystis hominis]